MVKSVGERSSSSLLESNPLSPRTLSKLVGICCSRGRPMAGGGESEMLGLDGLLGTTRSSMLGYGNGLGDRTSGGDCASGLSGLCLCSRGLVVRACGCV